MKTDTKANDRNHKAYKRALAATAEKQAQAVEMQRWIDATTAAVNRLDREQRRSVVWLAGVWLVAVAAAAGASFAVWLAS